MAANNPVVPKPRGSAMSAQQHVIDFLADAASYGRPGSLVERIDTHISIIFLLGDRAYKLKRAVRFSYLDYSSASLRGKYCQAELELNRRTAAQLYLRVRAIARTDEGTLRFDAEGEIVDWVLEVRRFAPGSGFDELLQAGRLAPALMCELADLIAAFHAGAERTPSFGGQTAIAETIAGNHANLVRSSPPLDADQVARVRAGSMAKLAEVGALLQARRDRGSVRRCHGDLHLRNICLFAQRPTPFDCIEFSDALSCIDVLYDLAFLLMDLGERGRADLANLVFNRYLDRTTELEGLRAVPLFMSIRAAIRAHVSLSMSAARASARNDALIYLALAERLLDADPPRLMAIGGASGTGKSTLAGALAPAFRPAPGARVIRSDVVRKRLYGVAPETRLSASAYAVEVSERVYALLCEQAIAVLATGYSVIVDATFLSEPERGQVATAARTAGVPFFRIWLDAPGSLLAERISARERDASDADAAVLASQLATETGSIGWQRLDGALELSAKVAAIRKLASLS